ncbi:MAG: leucine-rich repeat domain-containing protein [Bacteroidales bacterium]|nr:leucine-rich repeat domain-containing protein [Bacteroidales bacterium]
MKRVFLFSIMLIVALCYVNAQTFMSNGIWYKYIYQSYGGLYREKCAVIAPPDNESYPENLEVPATVEYNGKTYNVTADIDLYNGAPVFKGVKRLRLNLKPFNVGEEGTFPWYLPINIVNAENLESVEIPYFGSGTINIKNCHNIAEIKTIQWPAMISISSCNIKSLTLPSKSSGVTVSDMPNLEYLSFYASKNVTVSNCPNLEHLEVYGWRCGNCIMRDRIFGTFDKSFTIEGCDNVKSLVADVDCFKAERYTYTYALIDTIELFCNLKSVESLTLGECFTEISSSKLLNFNSYFPNVKSLYCAYATKIMDSAFADCPVVEEYTIGDYVTSISSKAFNGSNISRILTTPDCRFSVASYCLIDNTNNSLVGLLRDDAPQLSVPDFVKAIGSKVFYKNESLQAVELQRDWTNYIGSYAFAECPELTSFSLQYVNDIRNNAFSNCGKLEEFTAKHIRTIGNSAFSGCKALSAIHLSQAETIGDEAFLGCSGIKEIELAKAKTIGKYAFKLCNSLSHIKLLCETPPTLAVASMYDDKSCVFDEWAYENAIVTVPKGSLGAYKWDMFWRWFKNLQEGDYAGIEITESDMPEIKAVNGEIVVNGGSADIYTISGQAVGLGVSQIAVAPGIYIVRSGNNAKKIVVR